MTDADRSSRTNVLEKALETLEIISGSSLPPGQWEQFETAVAALSAALDADDDGVVRQWWLAIERLDPRQQNVAAESKDAPVKQPPRARSAGDNLTRRIKEKLADDDRGKR
jgi:hypothetical protein